MDQHYLEKFVGRLNNFFIIYIVILFPYYFFNMLLELVYSKYYIVKFYHGVPSF